MSTNSNFISISGLDPALTQLAEMVGLLKASQGDPDELLLQGDWFENPIEKSSDGIKQNPQAFAELLATLLGEVSGHALGIPTKTPGLLGNWHAIPNPESGKPTGLYLVTMEDELEEGVYTFSIGVMHGWELTADEQTIDISGYGLIPLLQLGNGNLSAVLGEKGYPITVGLTGAGANMDQGIPLIKAGDLSFNGAKISAALDIANSDDPFQLSIDVLSLKLPGEKVASNRSLADLAAISGSEIIQTTASLFVTALTEILSAEEEGPLQYLLPIFGLSSTIPNHPDLPDLPILRWDTLFSSEQAGDVSAPFRNWFRELTANTELLKAWLTAVVGFTGNLTANISGSGTREDPLKAPIVSIDNIGALSFCIGSNVNSDGTRIVYPGISFNATPYAFDDDISLCVAADLELATFMLSAGRTNFVPSNLQFDINISLQNASGPLASYEGYRCDMLKGGLALAWAGGTIKVVPSLQLTGVSIPDNDLGTVDLLSPSSFSNAASATLGSILTQSLTTLLNLNNGNEASDNAARLLGILPPTESGWPEDLAPPLSSSEIVNSLANPVGAMGAYYQNIANSSETVNNSAPFTFILQALAGLLTAATSSQTISVTGEGAEKNPWTVSLDTGDATLPAHLLIWKTPESGKVQTLSLAVSLTPKVNVADLNIDPSIVLQILDMNFADSKVNGVWLPKAYAEISLPDGYTSPSIADASFSVTNAKLSACWARANGWSWSLLAGKPTLTIGNDQPIELGQDINFSDKSSLDDLVTTAADTFAPMLTGLMGAALINTNTRPGLAFTALAGLLPDVSSAPNYPSGLHWPTLAPLQLTDLFTDPRQALRDRVCELYADQATGSQTMSLLSWALTPSLSTAPNIKGDMTFDSPLQVPIGETGLILLNWFVAQQKTLGIGLGKCLDIDYNNDISVTITSRVNAVAFDMANGSVILDAETPSASLVMRVYSKNGDVIPNQHGVQLSAFEIGLSCDFSNNQVQVTPIVNLISIQFPDEALQALVTLDEFEEYNAQLQQSFLTLLNAGITTLAGSAVDNASFQTAYNLLVSLGMAVPRPNADSLYGINPTGWTALFANPTEFSKTRLLNLLVDPTLRSQLYDLLQKALGISITTPPTPVLALFQALDFIGDELEGYPLNPTILLPFFNNPISTVKQQAQLLAKDTTKLQTLVAALAGKTSIQFPEASPCFEMSLVQGASIQVRTLPNAFILGDVIGINGSISFDIPNLSLTTGICLDMIPVSVSLDTALQVFFTANAPAANFACDLVWGDRSLPSAIPLTVYPFNADQFVNQVTQLAPVYALDVLTGAVIESELVNQYPLPRIVLQGLGMVVETDPGHYRVPALAGLLRDPLGWLLSDSVLGTNGQFSIPSFGKILARLTSAAPDGWQSTNNICVTPTNTALTVSGLPYHFSLSFSINDNNDLVLIQASTGGFSIAGETATLNTLSVGLTLNANFQPAIVGNAIVSTSAADGWFVNTGFDKNVFTLAIGQGAVDSPSGLQLDILPFLGWGNLAEQATKMLAPTVVKMVVPKVLDGLKQKDATKAFAEKLQQFGTDLNLAGLIDNLVQASPFTAENIEQQALNWLLQRFDSTNKDATANALVLLFSEITPIKNAISSSDGLVKYKPSDKIPVTIELGANSNNLLGLWAALELPDNLPIKTAISPTGIGIPLTGSFDPEFSFGIALTLPVDGDVGPQITLEFESGQLVMGLDPLGDCSDLSLKSSLYRELFPEFFPKTDGQSNDLSARIESWVVQVVTKVLPRYISVVLLNQDTVKKWLEQPLFSSSPEPTPASILAQTELIQVKGNAPDQTYILSSLDTLESITVSAFIGNLIKAMLSTQITVITFNGGKGEITVGPSPTNPDAFGARIQVADMAFSSLPYIRLQLGAEDTKWIKQANGDLGALANAKGLSVYIPVTGSGADIKPDFDHVELNLVNTGLDFISKSSAPLVSLSRFQLGSVSPRGLITFDLGKDNKVTAYGGELSLKDMMLSLAPNTLTEAGGGNPVAQNLLGSGTSDNTQNPPANPSFSLSTGYIQDQNDNGGLYVNLVGSKAGENAVVVKVDRTFGPLFIGSVGLGWEQADYLLDVLFTGNVSLAGLKADMTGLTVGIPVKTLADLSSYKLDLQGLDVTFNGGSVEISGGLLKTTTPQLMYTGAALVKAASFSISAMGSYTLLTDGKTGNTSPSLFIFGALNAPLGGIPAFFVTGLAAGFGYNRSLDIPSVGDVQNFPLVSGVNDGSFSEGQNPESALEVLNNVIAPCVGDYWLAAGLNFTTYKLLNSQALMILKFGRVFEIDLLALSSALLPPEVPKSLALAYVELAIKVSINPEQGVVSAEAQLTPNSYIIAKDCKLTGGFAFYLWMKNIQAEDGTPISAGDFVISLGGYHPAFVVPSYYPVVPRLGFQWLLDVGDIGRVDINGGAYFAIVPTAIMAGGTLNVVFTAGPLRAWLMAQANFLIEWQPFYFDVEISVSIGAAFHTEIAGVSITISAELGAALYLSGPPTHGHAKVSWYVISFTIPIGDETNATSNNNLDWQAFADKLLPSSTENGTQTNLQGAHSSLTSMTLTDAASDKTQQVIKITVENGLLQGPGSEAGAETGLWKIRNVPFSFNISSAIPVSKLTVTGFQDTIGSTEIGVRPMGKTTPLDAPLSIIITREGDDTPIDLKAHNLSIAPINNGVPAALWSRKSLEKQYAPNASEMIISDVLVGIQLIADDYIQIQAIAEFAINNLKYDSADGILPYYLTPQYTASTPYDKTMQDQALEILQASIMNSDVIASRNAVFESLRLLGMQAPANPNLSVMATSAALVMQAPPVLAPIGLYQNGGVTSTNTIMLSEIKNTSTTKVTAPAKPKLLAIRRQYHKTGYGSHVSQQCIQHCWVDSKDSTLAQHSNRDTVQNVHEGTMLLWALKNDEPYELSNDGSVDLRVVCMDKYGNLVSDSITKAGATAALDSNVNSVALEGIAANQGVDSLVGWDANTVLGKVSGGLYIAPNIAVQTQNGSRLKIRGKNIARGLVSVSRLLKQNKYLSPDNTEHSGWIKTIFSNQIQYIAVTLNAIVSDPQDQIVVSINHDIQPNQGTSVTIESVYSETVNNHTVLIYKLTEVSLYTEVVVRPLNNQAEVIGMQASVFDPVSTLKTSHSNSLLMSSAINPKAPHIMQSEVSLTQCVVN